MDNYLIGPRIKDVNEAIEKRINEQNRPYQLTLAQARVVLYLSEKEGHTAPQSELLDLLGVAHTTMIAMLRSMKRKGMVEITQNEKDRRSNDVTLTYGDSKIYRKLEQNAKSNEETLLKGFSQKEIDLFRAFLDRAYRNLAENQPEE